MFRDELFQWAALVGDAVWTVALMWAVVFAAVCAVAWVDNGEGEIE